ncbi:MAG: cytochrome c [Thiohalomonadales bacterium]|nr:cytochrome c [Thiohalomonadales bacterium]
MMTPSVVKLVGKIAGLVLLTTGSAAFAQEDQGTQSIGKMEFQKNCAACHGLGGKGDGPLVEFLKQTPPDLTLLSKKNGGVYPQAKVYEWIRDPKRVRAHGTDEMPIWGDRYSKEIIEYYGPDYTGPGSSVQQRILELVFYIGTIQQKP